MSKISNRKMQKSPKVYDLKFICTVQAEVFKTRPMAKNFETTLLLIDVSLIAHKITGTIIMDAH